MLMVKVKLTQTLENRLHFTLRSQLMEFSSKEFLQMMKQKTFFTSREY